MSEMEKVRRVKEQVERELLALPNVTGVDIGQKTVDGEKTDQLAIVVYVSEKKDVPSEDQVPAEIQGVPTDVVQRSFRAMGGGRGV